MTIRHDGLEVTWFGYATVRIETPDGFVVYVDPGRYGVLDDYTARDGDLVCVTHDHHYDSDGVERVAGGDATVVVFEGVEASRIDRDVTPVEDLDYHVVRVGEEDHLTLGGATVWTVPAYNEENETHVKADGTPHHPKGTGCGFLLSLAETTVFWPGDSDALDAYAELDVSLFLANIGGTVVSDRHESADLAERMDPDLVLPIHYDTFEMLETDSGEFAKDVARRGVPVVLDEKNLKQ